MRTFFGFTFSSDFLLPGLLPLGQDREMEIQINLARGVWTTEGGRQELSINTPCTFTHYVSDDDPVIELPSFHPPTVATRLVSTPAMRQIYLLAAAQDVAQDLAVR